MAVASALEGLQYAFAAVRTHEVGDSAARDAYVGGALIASISAIAGVWGSLAPAAMALAPLAAAVFLGFAALGFAIWAKGNESQPLELWARHSLWGISKDHRRWTDPKDIDAAVGALNAALLGLTADAGMTMKAEQTGGIPIGDAIPVGLFLDYKLVLPGYDSDLSSYEWVLKVYRPGQALGEIIAGGHTDGTNEPMTPPSSWRNPGYRPETTAPVISRNTQSGALEITGSISFSGYFEVHALEIQVSYWPDKSDKSAFARLVAKEDKIKGQNWLGQV